MFPTKYVIPESWKSLVIGQVSMGMNSFVAVIFCLQKQILPGEFTGGACGARVPAEYDSHVQRSKGFNPPVN